MRRPAGERDNVGDSPSGPPHPAHHDCGPSKLGLREMCPGSLRLEREARAAGEDLQPYEEEAAEGRLLHTLVNPGLPIPDNLTEEQRAVVLLAREYVAQWTPGAKKVEYERTMALWQDSNLAPLLFGTADVVITYADSVMVIDLKFGRQPLIESLIYRQLQAYAAMAMFECEVEKAEVRVYQPRLRVERACSFLDSKSVRDGLERIVDAAKAPDAPLRPSADACRYCVAKMRCPKFREELSLIPTEAQPISVSDLKKLLAMVPVIEKYAEQLRAHTKKLLLATPELASELGWELADRTTQEITNIDRAFSGTQAILSRGDFLACTKVQVAKLEDRYARAWAAVHCRTLKEGREAFAELMKGAIKEETQKYLRKKGE